MIVTKKKFVNVTPLSSKAKNRFSNIMQSFHACEVQQENGNMIFLASINRKYFFWIQREGNEHWRIDK
jgi:hypothetical protein